MELLVLKPHVTKLRLNDSTPLPEMESSPSQSRISDQHHLGHLLDRPLLPLKGS